MSSNTHERERAERAHVDSAAEILSRSGVRSDEAARRMGAHAREAEKTEGDKKRRPHPAQTERSVVTKITVNR